MADTHPEDLGRQLAQSVDQEALRAEAGSDSTEALLAEIRTSFKVQFQENQQGIQHELLDTAFHDDLRSRHTDPSNATKDQLLSLARNYARDALHEYANTILSEASVSYKDLPSDDNAGYYAFRDAIVEGYWQDTAQELIAQYEDAD